MFLTNSFIAIFSYYSFITLYACDNSLPILILLFSASNAFYFSISSASFLIFAYNSLAYLRASSFVNYGLVSTSIGSSKSLSSLCYSIHSKASYSVLLPLIKAAFSETKVE